MAHPLQPIRDAIGQVYDKALAENDEHLRLVALTALANLTTLCHRAHLPPLHGSSAENNGAREFVR